MIQFTIHGAPRTKKNHGYVVRAGGKKKHMPSKAWQAWVNSAIFIPRIPKETIDYSVNCEALFYRDALRGDAVGYYQGLADLLEKYRVVEDDKWIVAWDGSRMLLDRKAPRVEVTLRRM